MTQLAMKLGVAASTISRWENGVRTPSPQMWPRSAAALRLDPSLRSSVLAGNPVRRSDGPRLPGLGDLRRERGLTQRALRTALGIGATSVISWEHGRVRVPADRLGDVARVLGIDRATLLRSRALAPRRRTGERPLADLRRAAGMTQREAALHLAPRARGLVAREGRPRVGLVVGDAGEQEVGQVGHRWSP